MALAFASNKGWLSGQIIIFHQPRFPWNKGISLPQLHFGVRSCEVAIIWPLRRHWGDNISAKAKGYWNLNEGPAQKLVKNNNGPLWNWWSSSPCYMVWTAPNYYHYICCKVSKLQHIIRQGFQTSQLKTSAPFQITSSTANNLSGTLFLSSLQLKILCFFAIYPELCWVEDALSPITMEVKHTVCKGNNVKRSIFHWTMWEEEYYILPTQQPPPKKKKNIVFIISWEPKRPPPMPPPPPKK